MNKENYKKSLDELEISPDFKERTAKLMKNTLNSNQKNNNPINKRLILTFASAAVIISAGAFALNYNNNLSSNNQDNPIVMTESSTKGITIPVTEIQAQEDSSIMSSMMGLFVYKGRIYIQSNTTFELDKNFMVKKEDMLNLRGEYIGKTTGTIDEWSKQEDYTKEFASTIGESDIYTVKGYDSKYRLMAYSEYEGGFSCEIYDSFGGEVLKTGADYFDKLNLQDNITSYQWESYDSWNNGKGERADERMNDSFEQFISALYTSEPIGNNIDLFTENTENDSQKFVYVKTKDNLITTLRLFKEGYVYAPEAGFFKLDQDMFNIFWDTMPVASGIDVEAPVAPVETPAVSTSAEVTMDNDSYPVSTHSITLNIKNTGSEEIAYGVDYSIEKSVGDAWEVVPAMKNLMFIEIAQILSGNSEQDFVIDLKQLTPRLDIGHYRVVKNIGGEEFIVEFNLIK
ncbi:hypothetical protein EDD66_10460 [Mobilisporobacter senegalensis]|uniref:Bacterial Ig-like domain-containing protein n=1 Tax=Mobilisporobacter senegalensis TaxID=1329262 RepID=A0A3N1XQD5_9FIRM|nr:immunoglobulin-like domain-containing protein [Mobilisporobacter senegalensis]ROR28478.1 hypothetical protein EDD66_10460 [Mobilisporobacter senegalensis]